MPVETRLWDATIGGWSAAPVATTRAAFDTAFPSGTRKVYVATNGDDTAAGTTDAPYLTLQKALDSAQAGDKILLRAGTYAATANMYGKNGTATAWITIQPEVDGTVILDGSNLSDAGVLYFQQCSYFGVYGLEVRAVETQSRTDMSGIAIFRGCHHGAVWGNRIHDIPSGGVNCFWVPINTDFGIPAGSHDLLDIQWNTIWKAARYDANNSSGISIAEPIDSGLGTWSDGFAYHVRNNYVFDVECLQPYTAGGFDYVTDGNGISIDAFAPSNHPADVPDYTKQVLVESNILTGNGGRGVHVHNAKNTTIRQNTGIGNLRTDSPAINGSSEFDSDLDASTVISGNVILPRNTPNWSNGAGDYETNVVLGGTQAVTGTNVDKQTVGFAYFDGALDDTSLRSEQPRASFRAAAVAQPAPPSAYPAAVIPSGVNYTDYAFLPQSGDTFTQALNRLTTPTIVRNIPTGLYELIDFNATTHYSCYAPNCLGLWGAGVDKTVIQLRPGSSTQVALVPQQSTGQSNPLMMMRLSKQHILTRDLTIAGTDQPINPDTGKPHIYNGWVHYMTGGNNSGPGVGSQLYNVKFTGVPGDWNSPPGETMVDTGYIDTNTVEVGVEVDGYTWLYENTVLPDGTLKRTKGSHYGGGARGHYGSHNVTEYAADYHDGLVSGPTYSFHGVPTDYSATTQGVTTYDVKSIRNANWTSGSGQKFSGFNMENTYGPIRHYRPFITLTDLACTQWDAAHMAVNSCLGDNPDIQIIDPVWTNGYPRFNGMFTIGTAAMYAGVTQTQTTAPTVILNGVTLTPVRITGNPPSTLTQYPPDRFYAWTRA